MSSILFSKSTENNLIGDLELSLSIILLINHANKSLLNGNFHLMTEICVKTKPAYLPNKCIKSSVSETAMKFFLKIFFKHHPANSKIFYYSEG